MNRKVPTVYGTCITGEEEMRRTHTCYGRERIEDLLNHYDEIGDPMRTCRHVRELEVAFSHHGLVKGAFFLAWENQQTKTWTNGS